MKLHLGCGEKYLPGYVNIDHPATEHTVIDVRADIYADIRTLSYAENSIEEIRNHHMFEHFTRTEALKLLLTWRRWLMPDGRLVIETPDFAASVRAYVRAWSRRRRLQLGRHIFGSQEAAWANHLDFWDEGKFRFVLTRLGFKNIRVRRFRNSFAQHFSPSRLTDPFFNAVGNLLPESFYRDHGGNKMPNILVVSEKDGGFEANDRTAVWEILSEYLVGREGDKLLNAWFAEMRFSSVRPGPERLRLLFTVEFYEPRIGGAEAVVRQLAERLAREGHDVTVATTRLRGSPRPAEMNGVRIREFRLSGNVVTGIGGSRVEVSRYQALLGGDFDLVLNYAAQSWTTDLALPILDTMSAKKVMVPCGYSGLRNARYREYFAQLPAFLARYDALVYMSPNYRDKVFGDEHELGARAVLIPNGAAAEEFSSGTNNDLRQRFDIRTPHVVISVANHYVAKGHDFVIDAFRKMHRRDTTLLIVGAEGLPRTWKEWGHWMLDYVPCLWHRWTTPNVRLVDGRRREDVLAAYKIADVFLFGSRVECAPLVMYESFAAGVPFVTREVGNVTDHRSAIKIIYTPTEMAVAANDLLDHPDGHRALVEEGRKVWRAGHDWGKIADTYEKLFDRLAS
ncbi:MAG: glycosyltransferase [Patescibacteria group bacterium]